MPFTSLIICVVFVLSTFLSQVLGCGPQSEGLSNLSAKAEAPGYISVIFPFSSNFHVICLSRSVGSPQSSPLQGEASGPWREGEICNVGSCQLLPRYYLLRVSHNEMEEETVVVHNTSDHSLVLGSPLWGSLYGAELTCWQNELKLPCGSLTLVATPSLSPACRAHSSFCRDEEKVMVTNKTMIMAKVVLMMMVCRWFFCHLQISWQRALPTPRWRWSGRSPGVGGELRRAN